MNTVYHMYTCTLSMNFGVFIKKRKCQNIICEKVVKTDICFELKKI